VQSGQMNDDERTALAWRDSALPSTRPWGPTNLADGRPEGRVGPVGVRGRV